jgi:molybdopterin converting factor small subunit
MIRVALPAHLRELAKVKGEVHLELTGPATLAQVLDALEERHPQLKGTLRDQKTKDRRPFIRFFACEEDLSHDDPQNTNLPDKVLAGEEPLLIVGAIAGG